MPNKSILLIGSGQTGNYLNKIFNASKLSLSKINELFGTSSISQAYATLYEYDTIDEVYIANIKYKRDYIDIVKTAYGHNFDYVCPLNLLINEYYIDLPSNEKVLYSDKMLEIIKDSYSTLIFTGQHADLFENLDHFLNTEIETVGEFEDMSRNSYLFGNNIYYVSNLLKNSAFANVVFAAMFCNYDYQNYPSLRNDKAVFNYHANDFLGSKIIYFQNNYLRSTSIENLVNFSSDQNLRIVLKDVVYKYINKNLDYSRFYGKTFTVFTKNDVLAHTNSFLSSLKGNIIDGYKINDVSAITKAAGAVNITVDFDISVARYIGAMNMKMVV